MKAKVNVRVMCIDDLDNRYLGADLILDQTHILGVVSFILEIIIGAKLCYIERRF